MFKFLLSHKQILLLLLADGRVGQIEVLHRVAEHGRHSQPREPLVIGRHDVPGRPLSTCMVEHLFVGRAYNRPKGPCSFMSAAENFQFFSGSSARSRKRPSGSLRDMYRKNLTTMMPLSTRYFSKLLISSKRRSSQTLSCDERRRKLLAWELTRDARARPALLHSRSG